jgi:phosphatidylinositol alpha-1,6-mannosyltransferase
LPKLIRRYPNVRYLVVGKGPEENNLKRLASEVAVSEFVEFVGFVPDSQINAYYNLADIVVMPNREERDGDLEGFGMVFLEGNAAGKPVVGGRSGGAPEAVVHGETGMLVNSLDEDELLRTLGDLVASSDLRNRLGAAGLKRAREEFGWNSRAAKLRKISEAVIEARTRKRRD